MARWTPLDKLGPQNIDWSGFGNGQVWIALITFLYVDALDTTGTMTAMSRAAGLYNEVAGESRRAGCSSSSLTLCVKATLRAARLRSWPTRAASASAR